MCIILISLCFKHCFSMSCNHDLYSYEFANSTKTIVNNYCVVQNTEFAQKINNTTYHHFADPLEDMNFLLVKMKTVCN